MSLWSRELFRDDCWMMLVLFCCSYVMSAKDKQSTFTGRE